MDSLCIRRTFFDLARNEVSEVAIRSVSAPPPSSRRDSQEGVRAVRARYLSELFENAAELLCTKMNYDAQDQVIKLDSNLVYGEADLGMATQPRTATPRSSSLRTSSSSIERAETSTSSADVKKAVDWHQPTPLTAQDVTSLKQFHQDCNSARTHSSDCLPVRTSCVPVHTGGFMCTDSNLDTHPPASFSHRPDLRQVLRANGYQPFVPKAMANADQPSCRDVSNDSPKLSEGDTQEPVPQETACCTSSPQLQTALKETDTTLMLTDLPCRLMSTGNLTKALNKHGFGGTYDLVYIPPRQKAKRVKSNTGFGFVNFKKPCHAAEFVNKLGAFVDQHLGELISVSRATCQGFEENLVIHKKQCKKLELKDCLRTFET